MVLLAAVLAHVSGELVAQVARPDTSVEATVEAVRTYLAKYQADLTFILADETTTQRIIRQDPSDSRMPKSRSTTGEVYFKFLEAEGAWMAIRTVAKVNGVAVADRPDLRAALQNQNAAQVGRAFKAFNSQFNIGRVFRNFNEPTLALGILDSTRADTVEFTRKGVKTQNGATLVTLVFKERRGAESFIYGLLQRPAQVEGELVVEAGTGRIRKTTLKATIGAVQAELVTEYAHDQKTDLWVPVNFRELYEVGVDRSFDARVIMLLQHEAITCESKYTNFRRFVTTARIK